MNQYSKTTLLIFVLAASVCPLRADVLPHKLFTDHMVLQRDQPISVWGSAAPGEKDTVKHCPFPKSEAFNDITFTGRHAEYTDADTWYPSWASDNNMYSPWTDGKVNGLRSNSAGTDASSAARRGCRG